MEKRLTATQVENMIEKLVKDIKALQKNMGRDDELTKSKIEGYIDDLARIKRFLLWN